jgi:hypothetical protein
MHLGIIGLGKVALVKVLGYQGMLMQLDTNGKPWQSGLRTRGAISIEA